jgi:hypothetical protein
MEERTTVEKKTTVTPAAPDPGTVTNINVDETGATTVQTDDPTGSTTVRETTVERTTRERS